MAQAVLFGGHSDGADLHLSGWPPAVEIEGKDDKGKVIEGNIEIYFLTRHKNKAGQTIYATVDAADVLKLHPKTK